MSHNQLSLELGLACRVPPPLARQFGFCICQPSSQCLDLIYEDTPRAPQ